MEVFARRAMNVTIVTKVLTVRVEDVAQDIQHGKTLSAIAVLVSRNIMPTVDAKMTPCNFQTIAEEDHAHPSRTNSVNNIHPVFTIV